MTIEGNWIAGAMTTDYPKVHYKVVPLPAGPAGKGTLQFTNCWGIAARQPEPGGGAEARRAAHHREGPARVREGLRRDAVDQVRRGRLEEASSRSSRRSSTRPTTRRACRPRWAARDVVTDLNSKMAALKTLDIKALLAAEQKNLSAVVTG